MRPLTCPLKVSQDQDIIQTDNNIETLVMAMEQDRFSEGCGNPRGCGQPKKVKSSTDLGYCAKQIIKNYDDVA